jgi:hypothetical protein
LKAWDRSLNLLVAEGGHPCGGHSPLAFDSNGEMVMDTIIRHPASLRAPVPGGWPGVAPARHATPRDVLDDTGLSRVEKREILAYWASDACAVESFPALRQPPGAPRPISYDTIMRALRELDGLDPDGPRGGGASARPFAPRLTAAHWRNAGAEPTVEEALADPVVRLVMASDGVGEGDVYRALSRAGLRRAGGRRVAWRG